MSMRVATLMMMDDQGKTYSVTLAPSEAQEVKFPEPLVGPFNFEFSLGDKDGAVKNFDCKLLINRSGFVASFKVFPILGQTVSKLLPTARIESFCEMQGAHHPIGVFALDIEKNFKSGTELMVSWVTGSKPTVAIYNEKGEQFTIPFYNFYENGTLCMGTIKTTGTPMQRFLQLISSITTPHYTYNDKSVHWRVKDGNVIEDQGRKVTNHRTDIPELKEFITRMMEEKPLGTLTP